MSDQTVNECEGIFFDSDGGQPTGNYDHNEDYTFTICVPTSDSVIMTFSDFCSEAGYDFITFHDGPNTSSPVIEGPLSGTISIPTIIATSGCLTVHFVTDANVACTGWVAQWYTIIEPPEPPEFNISPSAPTCSTSSVVLVFDNPIPCDSVYPSAFDVDGPVNQSITGITPLNCNGGEETQFQVDISPGMDESGSYDFDFTYFYVDPCDNFYVLNSSAIASVNDCPLQVELEVEDNPICPSTCTEIEAIVTGGDPNTYSYVWSNGLPNSPGPHTVCLAVATTITVTVSDAGPSASSSASATIDMKPSPTAQNDTTLCQSENPFNLSASPGGGEWYGPGVSDESTGLFHPDSGGGNHVIYYYLPNECFDSVTVSVTPIDAGPPEASCPGAAPFNVTGFNPIGGVWSGPNITSNGVFDPIAQGAYDVTYTHPNGCDDTKTIYVDNMSIQGTDTICRSHGNYQLTFSPFGGVWSGSSGITDPLAGIFNSYDAGPGSHNLTYTMNGCSQQVEIFVKNINVGGNITACPDETPFIVANASPAGGTWTGIGIMDPVSGMYNPGVMGGQFNDTLYYTVDGCSARKIVYVRYTVIGVDTIEFCEGDDEVNLRNNTVGISPGWGGVWTGNGITESNNNGTGKFDPAVAGPGTHVLTFTNNNCSDELVMVVHPLPTLLDTSTCGIGNPINLVANPPGGIWDGDGIIDANAGTFDPQDSGLGFHTIRYESPAGCIDSMEVEVYQLTPAYLNGLNPEYCYYDTMIPMTGAPVGGIFSGNGVIDTTFNPTLAGEGQHVVTYTYGFGNCAVSDDINLTILPPISTTIEVSDDDSICFYEVANISVKASGGDGGIFNYDWNNGLGYGSDKVVQPDSPTQYIVTVSDGCSEDKIDTIDIHVFPKFTINFSVGDSVCYDEPNSAEASITEPGNYMHTWHTIPISHATSISAPAGHDYELTVRDNASGCVQDSSVRIPSYPFVMANFSPIPDGECEVELDKPNVQFTDLSTGGVSGYWDFGDGGTASYEPQVYPEHIYADTGVFNVQLIVENEGGCVDTTTKALCVTVNYKLHIPNTFTPNGDNLNDIFVPVSVGIVEFRMDIYNRWGEKVHTMNSVHDGWDGTFRGKIAPNGVYSYYVYAYVLVEKRRKPLKLRGTVHLLRGIRPD